MTGQGAAYALQTGEGWPKPLPVVLTPAPDEALSSWISRHAAFYGLSRTAMHRHCAPDAPSLHGLDRALTPGQEDRLAHLFRRDRADLRRMTHADLDSDLIGRLVGRSVDHHCEACVRSFTANGFAGAVPRAWFHTWRITCARCGSRVLPAVAREESRVPDLFPQLWSEALEGEQFLSAFVQRTGPVPPVLPTTLLRLLMILVGEGRTLEALVPGFDAAVRHHQIAIPRKTLIVVFLPARTALLAGLALAMKAPGRAIDTMWAATSGPDRAHFGYVLAEMPAERRARLRIAA